MRVGGGNRGKGEAQILGRKGRNCGSAEGREVSHERKMGEEGLGVREEECWRGSRCVEGLMGGDWGNREWKVEGRWRRMSSGRRMTQGGGAAEAGGAAVLWWRRRRRRRPR